MTKPSDGNKKPVIEQVAEMAMRLAQPYLAEYGAVRSRHDYTQRQHMSCLVLRAYLQTTYRGVVELLASSASLRQCLGLEDKLPHYTTLQKFSARTNVAAVAQKLISHIGKAAAAKSPESAVAMDSTGLATTTASAYFRSRSGKACKEWVKVSTIVLCGSLIPLAVVLDVGPSNDRVQVPALLDQAQAVAQPKAIYADAGYDAEWIHQRCQKDWGVESVIKPSGHRADGKRNGEYRSRMSARYLKNRGYGSRWAVETFFSALKRTMGAALKARQPKQMLAEAAFKVLAYALRR